MKFSKRPRGPVEVVRVKRRSLRPEEAAQVYSQDDLFGRLKKSRSPANLAVEVTKAEGSDLHVRLLEDCGPLTAGDSSQASWRASRLDRDLTNEEVLESLGKRPRGMIVDLQSIRLHDDALSYKALNVVGRRGEIGKQVLEVRPDALVSIRHTVAMQEGGVRPEIFAIRRQDSIPIKQVMSGLDDMLAIIQNEDGYGEPGFLLRGTDPKSGRRYAAICVMTLKDKQMGVTPDDVLGEFLRNEVPGLSRMVREAYRKKEPWSIVPVDVLPTTDEFVGKASQLGRSIPFRQTVKGESIWFAESLLALRRQKSGWEASYISPRRNFPMLVGTDFPDGAIEPPVEVSPGDPDESDTPLAQFSALSL